MPTKRSNTFSLIFANQASIKLNQKGFKVKSNIGQDLSGENFDNSILMQFIAYLKLIKCGSSNGERFSEEKWLPIYLPTFVPF